MPARTASLALLCLALSAPGAGARSREPKLPKRYTTAGFPEARFTCRVPARWKKLRSGELDPAATVRGILLLGPQERDGFSPTITVYYYEPDNDEFETVDDYIETYYNPAIRSILGQDVEKPKALEVAGLPARSFRRDAFEEVPRHTLDSRNLKKRETHVVLEYDGGFFALTYSAPQESYEKWRPVFERVLESFRPVAEERTADQAPR